MPSRQMWLVIRLKEKRKSGQKCEWKTGDGVGRRSQEGKEGVVVSFNKFNLNPKLTRCRDCRVLKYEGTTNQRQQWKKREN